MAKDKKVGRGQRRVVPPAGYMTYTEATSKLGRMLYKHVQAGRVRKLTLEGYQHGFYHAGDVEKIAATYQVYQKGAWKENPTSTFAGAEESDMPAIIDIDQRTFGEAAASLETSLSWLRKNPDTFFVLRNMQGVIVGYGHILPLSPARIDQFVRGEIDGEDISADDIPIYELGQTYHWYIMAIAVDPNIKGSEKTEYGARLLEGLFDFLLHLAEQGIEIRTITARNEKKHKPDGLRLLRAMGFSWLRSPVAKYHLFTVKVAESGFPLFIKYTEQLAEWRAAHSPPITRETRPTRATRMPSSRAGEHIDHVEANRPPGALTLQEYADQLGITRSSLYEQAEKFVKAGGNYTRIPHPARAREVLRYFTSEEQAAFSAWRSRR